MHRLTLMAFSVFALACFGSVPLSAQTSPPAPSAPAPPPPAAAAPAAQPGNPPVALKAAPRTDAANDKAAQEKSKLAADALLERHTHDAQRAIQGICSGCMGTVERDAPKVRRRYAAQRPSRRMRRAAIYDGPVDIPSGPGVAPVVFATPARRLPVPAEISAFPSDR